MMAQGYAYPPLTTRSRTLNLMLAPPDLSCLGLEKPLRLAAGMLAPDTLQIEVCTPHQAVAGFDGHWHIALLVADEG